MIRIFVFLFCVDVTVQLTIFQEDALDVYEGDVCNETDGHLWTCQKVENCASAIEDIKRHIKPPLCGYNGKTPVICCRRKSPITLLYRDDGLQEGDACNTNSGEKGTCQRPFNCPTEVAELRQNIKPMICAYDGGTPIICCKETNNQIRKAWISFEACLDYQTSCRPNFGIPVENKNGRGNTTDDSLNLPMFAIGGEQTAPKEFPPMEKAVFRPFVVGGRPSIPKQYPHMALIGYGEASGISWQCGGSLISARYVLSAAHCTSPGNAGPARWVRLGDLNIASKDDDARPEEYQIISRINHPGYQPPALYNDIALYKLNKPVTYNSYISPICLTDVMPQGNQLVIATGWGRIGPSGPKSNHLMKVDLHVIPYEICKDLFKVGLQLPRGIDDESMICAGELSGGKDTCQGDSGGPLMFHDLPFGCVHQQLGITSFGTLCGAEKSPGVYTRLSKYIPWVESILSNDDDNQ